MEEVRIGVGTRRLVGWGAAMLALVGCAALTGCQFFFQCAKTSCADGTTSSSGSSTGNTGDYAYVANSTSGTSYLAAYEISTGSPIALAGSPYNLTYVPAAMVVAPSNSLMFISNGLGGLIYAYSIASNGSISILNNGQAVVNETALAMDISADGNYLFVLNEQLASLTVDQFSINSSTGALSTVGSLLITPTISGADAIKVAPSGDFVVVSMGTTGDEIFPLVSEKLSTGVKAQTISPPVNTGDFAVTIDSNDVMYVARTGLVIPYQINAGVAAQISNTVMNSITGAGDHSITLSKTGAYLYTGNATGNSNGSNISGFSNSSGNLGLLSGTPYTAPSSVAALAADNTGKYVIAAGTGNNGIAEYTIGSTGALTIANNSSATGTGGITLLAVTH